MEWVRIGGMGVSTPESFPLHRVEGEKHRFYSNIGKKSPFPR